MARPTDRLDEVVRFHREGLGLEEAGGFRDHDGYDGVILRVPGGETQVEFTTHRDGSPCPAPTRDNLLVLYLKDRAAVRAVETRMGALGFPPVEPENPYWTSRGLTFEDPDGWRVVVVDSTTI